MRVFVLAVVAAGVVVNATWAQLGGQLAVYRVGDASAPLVNTGAPVFIDVYSDLGVLLQSVPVPSTSVGGSPVLIASGTASSEGLITTSVSGAYVLFAGYNRPLGGSGTLANTSAATVNRVVGRMDVATRTVQLSQGFTDFADANNPRSVTSEAADQLFMAGGSGGVRFATATWGMGGTGTSTQLNTDLLNIRQLNLVSGQLYGSTASGSSFRIFTVGSGAPTTSGQTVAQLPGLPTSGSPSAFVFADLSVSVPGNDVLYVADDGLGVQKFSLVGGTWVANGVLGTNADDYRGLTKASSCPGFIEEPGVGLPTSVTLYATRLGGTTGSGGGELVSFTDTTGYNVDIGTPAVTVLSTAATNTAYRGVTYIPVCGAVNVPPVLLGVASRKAHQ